MAELKVGDQAPEFTLPDETGKPVSLSDFKGKRVVLFFYPRDNTPGCTAQACGFRDEFSVIQDKNAVVLGVSGQGAKSHQSFKAKNSLPFPLLSDESLALTHALRLPTMSVAGMTLIKRLAMVIDDGVIKKVFYPVFPPDRNAPDVLAWLESHRPS